MKTKETTFVLATLLLISLVFILPRLGLFAAILPEGEYNEYGDCEFTTNVDPLESRYNEYGSSPFGKWIAVDFDGDGILDPFGWNGMNRISYEVMEEEQINELRLLIENYNSEGDDIYYYHSDFGLFPTAPEEMRIRLYVTHNLGDLAPTYRLNFGDSEYLAITECGEDCIPETCESLGKECAATWFDGCGRYLDCGTCEVGFYCDSGTCSYSYSEVILKPIDLTVTNLGAHFLIEWDGGVPPYDVNIDLGQGSIMEQTTYDRDVSMAFYYSEDGTYDATICVYDLAQNYDCENIEVIITTACNTNADTNCNGIVTFQELNTYAQSWVNNQVSFNDLITAANAWVST